MSIVALKKLTLCGIITDKSRILKELQNLGVAHLIPLDTDKKTLEHTEIQGIDKALVALKYLQSAEKKRHQVQQEAGFDFHQTIADILELKETLIQLSEQRDFLEERINDVALWGDFTLAKNGVLQGYKLWFYRVPKRLMRQVEQSPLIWQQVNQSNTLSYVVVIAKDEPDAKQMPVPRTHVGEVSLSILQNQLEKANLDIEDAYAKRDYLTRWITLILLNLAKFKTEAELEVAHLVTHDETDLFIIQAWVANDLITRVKQFASSHQLACLVESPDSKELPPTLLKNTNTFAGGEEIVKFYQMPNYYGWDPSIVVFFSFALFFAMILSDAGYAAVFLSILAVKWQKMGKTIKGLRFRMLMLVTLSSSLLWGILAGSYFGFSPNEMSLIGRIKIFDMNDFDTMMKISISVGVAHIAFANLVQAYQFKANTQRYASLGWALLVIGGFVLWLSMDQEDKIVEQLAYALLTLAALALLLFSSDRAIKRPLDFLFRLFDGIKSLTGITKIFGDVLSYMRLFALGLASASLAITFNQLAIQVYESTPGLGVLFSILILLIGHSLNILLGIMSGVVHGLRLNFIEFYNWSVSDEGYPFNVFSKKEDYQ